MPAPPLRLSREEISSAKAEEASTPDGFHLHHFPKRTAYLSSAGGQIAVTGFKQKASLRADTATKPPCHNISGRGILSRHAMPIMAGCIDIWDIVEISLRFLIATKLKLFFLVQQTYRQCWLMMPLIRRYN